MATAERDGAGENPRSGGVRGYAVACLNVTPSPPFTGMNGNKHGKQTAVNALLKKCIVLGIKEVVLRAAGQIPQDYLKVLRCILSMNHRYPITRTPAKLGTLHRVSFTHTQSTAGARCGYD